MPLKHLITAVPQGTLYSQNERQNQMFEVTLQCFGDSDKITAANSQSYQTLNKTRMRMVYGIRVWKACVQPGS